MSAMNSLILRSRVLSNLAFVLTLIGSACLADICNLSPGVTQGPTDANILLGGNHTFSCEGNGSNVDWEINDIPVHYYKHWDLDPKLEVVNASELLQNSVCSRHSILTIHIKIASGNNTSFTFTVNCVMKKHSLHGVPSKKALLNVHVIGSATDVKLVPPSSQRQPSMMKWEAADVFSGSSIPLSYNISVMSSTQMILQTTTANTSFAIDSDLLVPCASYQLSVLPFQQISNRTEFGIISQMVKNYSGTLLPAMDVKSSVFVKPDLARVTVHFQVIPTSCSLQWPEQFTVTVMQQAANSNESLQLVTQTVTEVENKYIWEEVDLRQKYQLSIILENNFTSSISKLVSVSTFNVQNLTLELLEDRCKLNVQCEMAEGAEDKECTVEMTNEAGAMHHNCISTSGTNTTCILEGLTLGKYMIWGYDKGYEGSPAVKRDFLFTQEPDECTSTTWSPTKTDDPTTIQSLVTEEVAVRTKITVGILVPLVLIIVTASVTFTIVKLRKRRQKHKLTDPESPLNGKYFPRNTKDNDMCADMMMVT